MQLPNISQPLVESEGVLGPQGKPEVAGKTVSLEADRRKKLEYQKEYYRRNKKHMNACAKRWREQQKIKTNWVRRVRPAKSAATKEFIMANVAIDEKGCWNWTRCLNDEGYGNITHLGRGCKTHRIAWELWKGSNPGELKVCHHCDNPKCCNPTHLFLGTDLENSEDAARKERRNKKLTIEQARLIFHDRRQYKEIMREYGITKGLISAIKHKKSRKVAVENESHGPYIPTDRRRHVP